MVTGLRCARGLGKEVCAVADAPKLYLDTSSYNKFFDDPENRVICNRLVFCGWKIQASAINAVEILATPDPWRRAALARFCDSVRDREFRLLQLPSRILRRGVEAYLTRDRNATVSVCVDEETFRIQHDLTHPDELPEEDRQSLVAWKEKDERSFLETHKGGREPLQEVLGEIPSEKWPKNAAEFVKSFADDRDRLEGLMGDFFVGMFGEHARGRAFDLLQDCGPCVFYFDAWAFSIYDRGIRQARFGRKHNPGVFDISQAVYLQGCDIFVTDDRSQRRFLRQLRTAFHREKRIMTYGELREAMLPGCLQ